MDNHPQFSSIHFAFFFPWNIVRLNSHLNYWCLVDLWTWNISFDKAIFIPRNLFRFLVVTSASFLLSCESHSIFLFSILNVGRDANAMSDTNLNYFHVERLDFEFWFFWTMSCKWIVNSRSSMCWNAWEVFFCCLQPLRWR
jgi:hypothetical protein